MDGYWVGYAVGAFTGSILTFIAMSARGRTYTSCLCAYQKDIDRISKEMVDEAEKKGLI